MEQSGGSMQVSYVKSTFRSIIENVKRVKSYFVTAVLSGVLGYVVGILPAAGATPGSLMAYGLTKTFSKDPESFGKGNVTGVAAPESANNAASTGSMLPMLTLGIPGSPTTAILLGGMIIWGLRPGPLLFVEHPDFVWGLIGSLYMANIFTVIVNIAFIPVFVRVLVMPFTILAPVIFVLCLVGGYSPNSLLSDVWLMVLFGVSGYILRKLDYPVAPAVLAIVLGQLAERSLRQSLLSSQGDPTTFFERPLSAIILACAVGLVLVPVVRKMMSKRPAVAGASEG
jgi:putative tricarboxylic transport membrane protein